MEKNMRERTGELLIYFGVDPGRKGFWYIVDAVELFQKNKSITECFRQIAKRENANASAIERATMNAFKKLNWEKESVKEFFGDVPRTNGALIGVIVWKLSERTENEPPV